MVNNCLIINLDSRKDLWNNLETFRNKWKSEKKTVERIQGVTLKNEENVLLQLIASNRININGSGFRKNKNSFFGELGCFMSHYNCWKYVVDNDLDNCLILEDGIEFLRDDYKNLKINNNVHILFLNEEMNNSTGRGIEANPPISIPDTEAMPTTQAIEMTTNKRLVGGTTQKDLNNVADMIVKICGNASLLINQIVPSNFVEYWNILKPLMKPQYQTDGPAADEKRNQLFELVVTRDNIGEAMWYIYTGLLITSIVQLKIATRGCVVDPAQMAKNYQKYISEQEAAKKQQKQATSSVYTLSN
jgi:GR25 family glycosyltransferase involved in LPS biosynthesis